MMEKQKKLLKEVKVVLLGSSQVGKSSIVHRFIKGKFYPYSESTVGVAFLQKVYPLKDDVSVKFDIWDTAGQERFGSLAPMYYRGAPTAIVVYDVTNTESFEKAKSWIRELKVRGKPSIVIALVGNKIDLADQRRIPTQEAKAYAVDQEILFCETSAKNGENIRKVFGSIAENLNIEDLDEVDEQIENCVDLDGSYENDQCLCLEYFEKGLCTIDKYLPRYGMAGFNDDFEEKLKLYKDYSRFNVKREGYKYVEDIYLALFFADLVIHKGTYLTKKTVDLMMKSINTQRKRLSKVSKSYRPKVILSNSSLKTHLSVLMSGSGVNVFKSLQDYCKRKDVNGSLIFFEKKRIATVHYFPKEDQFSKFVLFEPKGRNLHLYYFDSVRLVERYVKSIFDTSLLRISVVGKHPNFSPQMTYEEDQDLVKNIIKEEEEGEEEDRPPAKVEKKKEEEEDEEEIHKPSPINLKDREKMSPNGTGFTNFIDQFIKGEKKVDPKDRLLISHEREIKKLKALLESEKEKSKGIEMMVKKLQGEIARITSTSVGNLSEKIKQDVEEIKNLKRYKQFEDFSACVVCMNNKKDSLLLPCKHLCICSDCGDKVIQTFGKCPYCNQKVTSCITKIIYV